MGIANSATSFVYPASVMMVGKWARDAPIPTRYAYRIGFANLLTDGELTVRAVTARLGRRPGEISIAELAARLSVKPDVVYYWANGHTPKPHPALKGSHHEVTVPVLQRRGLLNQVSR